MHLFKMASATKQKRATQLFFGKSVGQGTEVTDPKSLKFGIFYEKSDVMQTQNGG